MFFILLVLYGLPPEYFTNCNQILGSSIVPTLSMAWSTLPQVLAKKPSDSIALTPSGTTTLVFQNNTMVAIGNITLVKCAPTVIIAIAWAILLTSAKLYMVDPHGLLMWDRLFFLIHLNLEISLDCL